MKTLRAPTLVLLLAATGAGLFGCGLIVNSAHQTIVVTSEPPGAEVRTGPKALQYWTPALITLPRKYGYLLRFEMPGYRDDSLEIRQRLNGAVLAADVLFTAGIGVVLDGITGSWYQLTPERAFVTLVSIAGAQPIAVAVRVESDTVRVVSSRPGVVIYVDQR